MMIEFNDASAGTTTLYPADRCTWRQIPTANGYEPSFVMFYPGNAAPVDLTGVAGDRITLGYIGKSGRFVPISETNVRR